MASGTHHHAWKFITFMTVLSCWVIVIQYYCSLIPVNQYAAWRVYAQYIKSIGDLLIAAFIEVFGHLGAVEHGHSYHIITLLFF